MAKKIHITESQLKEIFKQINKENQVSQEVEMLDEISLNGDEQLGAANGDMLKATKNVIKTAQESGVNMQGPVNVAYSNDSLRQNGIQEHVKKMTKKSIKEARLQKLVKESVKLVRKKDLK